LESNIASECGGWVEHSKLRVGQHGYSHWVHANLGYLEDRTTLGHGLR
jgi:hypothetical protein